MNAAPHVLVTGGAGVIGQATARTFVAQTPGARITLADIDGPGATRAADAIGADATGVVWDLSRPETLPTSVAELEAQRGHVDVLINCAGIMEIRSLVATDWALAERLLAIDLWSPLRLMSLLAPGMQSRRHGTIVNVSSMAGVTPLRGCVYYGAAKAGLAMASEIARIELAPYDVRVVTVYPGPVHSPLEARARAQAPVSLLSRWLPTGDANQLAARITRACERNEARVVYPAIYTVASRLPVLAGMLTRAVSPVPLDRA